MITETHKLVKIQRTNHCGVCNLFATSATHSLYLILSKNHWSERWKLVRDIRLGYLVLNSVFLIWWGSCTHESQKYAYLNQRNIMAAPVDMTMYRRNSTRSHPLRMRCRWSITVERRRIRLLRGQAPTQFVLSQVLNSRHMHTWALLKWLNKFFYVFVYVKLVIEKEIMNVGRKRGHKRR